MVLLLLLQVELAIAEPAPVGVGSVKKEIVIEVIQTEPTQEQIMDEIRRVFPDAPIMMRVAFCEGTRGGKLDPEVVNPTNGSNDTGVFQISEKYHHRAWNGMGFTDMTDYVQNIAYARVLYDQSGLQPWSASRHCWST